MATKKAKRKTLERGVQQKAVSLFLICVVLLLPFSSASALAATISVTKNSGSANVAGFLDGNGDTWNVEALVAGAAGTVLPQDVRLQVGVTDQPFASCSASVGGQLCSYSLPLEEGVAEGSYPFSVAYLAEESASARSTISSDLSASTIRIAVLRQQEGSLFLDMTVTDDPTNAAGLQKIEILDADTQQLFLAIDEARADFTLGQREYHLAEQLPGSFSGEGQRRITVKAVDRLGHEAMKPSSTPTDFVQPEILGTVQFPDAGDFIGAVTIPSSLTVDVRETSDLNVNGVTAASEQLTFENPQASCTSDDEEPGLKHCIWENVEIAPQASLSVKITATDAFGNVREATIQKTFTPDTTAPVVEFFGTPRTFEGKSFVKQDENLLLLKARDDGSGLAREKITAKLGAFSGRGDFDLPDECHEDGDLFICTWKVRLTQDTDRVSASLTIFKDLVGNDGPRETVELLVDPDAPDVEEVEVLAVGDAGEKNYFQSNDRLRLKLKVAEQNGLLILVDLQDPINDAETLFPNATLLPSGEINEAGWAAFTSEDDCEREEGLWACTLDITADGLKSGTGAREFFTLQVLDTAGNAAENYPEDADATENARLESAGEGEYSIELLGVAVEEEPEYWEVDTRNVAVQGFVDLATTQLIYPRLSVNVPLRSDDATALNVQLSGCELSGERSGLVIKRNLLYGGNMESVQQITPTIVLEFDQFAAATVFPELPAEVDDEEFRAVEVPAVCQFFIYSQLGDLAVKNAEVQLVNLSLPFSYSKYGELAQNIDEKVEEARDTFAIDIAGTVADLKNIVEWLQFVNSLIIRPVIFALKVINIATASTEGIPEPITRTLLCGSLTDTESTIEDVIQWLQVPSAFLSCSPVDGPYMDFIGEWQEDVLDYYNNDFLQGDELAEALSFGSPELHGALTSATARGLDDNLILSAVGLCLPGIIENMERITEIQCRYVYCLENEAAQGVPFSVCEDMRSQMECKYGFGEVFRLIPFFSPADALLGSVENTVRDPIGLAMSILWETCKTSCTESSSLSAACTATTIIGE
ncbi:MAG: hypothetical protein Q8R53_04370, partial [Nanoarchaeota archaeon]|nr:hypothetical protein [Nanoarchaeota archaeon]